MVSAAAYGDGERAEMSSSGGGHYLRGLTASYSPTSHTPEPFTETRKAAEFVAIKPARLLDLVRAGKVRAYPVGLGSKRHHWVFRLSELAEDIANLRKLCFTGNMDAAALVSRRRGSNG